MLYAGTVLYRHWDITNDYALYSQAWYLIAHGHLNPYSTVAGIPFWKNHFELAMWPLSALYWVTPATVGLKWIQSTAAVGAEVVAFAWVLDILRRHREHAILAASIAAGFVVLLLANANFYSADWFDFHFQSIATLLLLLAGRDLHAGRTVRPLVWAGLMLLTGDVAATYIIGLGLAAIVASRPTRRTGLVMVAAGAAWVAMVSAMGANVGSDLIGGLGYLAVGTHVTIFTIVAGMVLHPGRWLHILHQRWRPIVANVRAGGIIGILAPWALIPILAVLIPSALQQNIGYISSPFQNLAALVLAPVGTVLVLEWLGRRGHTPARRHLAVIGVSVLGLAVFGTSIAYSLPKIMPIKRNWFAVAPSTARQLDSIRMHISPQAQVIVSSAVSGGFGGRSQLEPWIGDPQSFPLAAGHHVVVFVFDPNDPLQPIPSAAADNAIANLEKLPGTRVAISSNNVVEIQWVPPKHARSISLPSAVPR
jgi:hypothetical protein